MSSLQTLPGIGQSSVELLEAAGFLDEASLAKAKVDELVAEMGRANAVLKLASETPERTEVAQWISVARERMGIPECEKQPIIAGEGEISESPVAPVAYEIDPEVLARLASAPFAIPIPAKVLIENGVRVSDIPPAMLLSEVSEDLSLRTPSPMALKVGGPITATAKASKAPANLIVQQGEAPVSKRDIDTSRVKNFSDYVSTESTKPMVPREMQDERIALLRAPRESTNRGRDPKSRRYVRGVLHSHPGQMLLGAFVTLLVITDLPLAIISAILLLLSDMSPLNFSWVPKWLLVFPIALPVCGILYFILGASLGKCRICGQRQFFPKNCRKNSKAHHIKGIGYIVPTALHMLVFRWFRCTYCGTPVRLKE